MFIIRDFVLYYCFETLTKYFFGLNSDATAVIFFFLLLVCFMCSALIRGTYLFQKMMMLMMVTDEG